MNAKQTAMDAHLQAILGAVVARLIPDDDLGRGAAEARADRYILLALAGPLSGCAAQYAAGLNGVNALAIATYGRDFTRLNGAEQDAVLRRLEVDAEIARVYSAEGFFELVREHTIEGFLGDPKHGGNHDRVGWKLIGYTPTSGGFSANQQGLTPDSSETHS
jgi:gluconate 2-dehydrogenase gamma chain